MKYRNTKTIVDGITFDSKREAARYQELRLLEEAGEIGNLRRQVKFELIPAQYDRRNRKLLERAVSYIADFVYETEGFTVVEDVKSSATKTRDYIIKRKLLLYYYGLRIQEV